MKRRTFINTLAMLPLAAKMGSLWAAPAAQAKLLVVFLRGGYDAANLLIPVASQFYYDSRPNIAVPRPGTDLNTALALNADWGLHPACARASTRCTRTARRPSFPLPAP